MKKRFVKALAAAAVIGASGLPVQAETVLKLASIAPSGTPWGKWVTSVAEQIEETSGGELKIDLLLDAQAGDESTILRQTIKGRLDIAFVSNVPMTLLAKELAIPSAAYLYDTPEQGTCVTYNHLTDTFGGLMQDAGVVPLTWMEMGHYIMFSKEPVDSLTDMQDMKIRIAPSIADAALADAWGIQGVPLGTAETTQAIQTGAIDGLWAASVFGLGVGTYKIAPYVTVTNHSRLTGTMAVSKHTWDKLSDQEKEWLGLFAETAPQLTQGILGAEQALLAQAEGAGVAIKHLEGEELAAWKGINGEVLDAIIVEAGGTAQEIADKIEAAKAACGS